MAKDEEDIVTQYKMVLGKRGQLQQLL